MLLSRDMKRVPLANPPRSSGTGRAMCDVKKSHSTFHASRFTFEDDNKKANLLVGLSCLTQRFFHQLPSGQNAG